MAINRAEVAKTELFKKDVLKQQVFRPLLDLVGKDAHGLTRDLFDKIGGLPTNSGVGRVRLQGVEVAGDGPDVFVDRPFVVVEYDDELFRRFSDVVECFKRRTAGESGVACDSYDVVITAG